MSFHLFFSFFLLPFSFFLFFSSLFRNFFLLGILCVFLESSVHKLAGGSIFIEFLSAVILLTMIFFFWFLAILRFFGEVLGANPNFKPVVSGAT